MSKGVFRKKAIDNNRVEWFTPKHLFDELDAEFEFTLDPCAPIDPKHRLPVEHHFTLEDNGLILPWHGRVFMNPPYGWHVTERWIEKACLEAGRDEVEIVVGLIPSHTDTEWFHEYVLDRAEIRFLRGRVKFHNSKAESYRGRIGNLIVIWQAKS